MDRLHLGIVASDQAIQDANNLEGVSKRFWSGYWGLVSLNRKLGLVTQGRTPGLTVFIPKLIVDIAAGYISMRHGLGSQIRPLGLCIVYNSHYRCFSFDKVSEGGCCGLWGRIRQLVGH